MVRVCRAFEMAWLAAACSAGVTQPVDKIQCSSIALLALGNYCQARQSPSFPTKADVNQFDKKSQAWSALFSEPMSDLVKRYTASVFFDKRLWQADITGSLAHADMLAAQGIIGAADHTAIQQGMAQITHEIESGAFDWQL